MTMAEGMQHIVDDIDSSRAARISDIRDLNRETAHIRAGARGTIRTFRSARKREAVALHRTLRAAVKVNRKTVRGILHDARDTVARFHEARIESARETDEELKEFVGILKKDVANIRIDANNMVHGFAEEQLSRGIELSRMLKASTDAVTHDVERMMEGFADTRSEVKAEIDGGHEVWQRHSHTGTPRPAEKKAPVHHVHKIPKKAPVDELEAKVLKIVGHSPKGITLAKAGKKLDIEWRKLVAPAKRLMASGMIRKKESSYFPVL